MSEVLSLASGYCDIGGSELSLLLQTLWITFYSADAELNAVATCDLLHERMAMDGVPKYLILEPHWYLLVASQIAIGIFGCVHKFFGSVSCSNV